jgi:hypothetical protein
MKTVMSVIRKRPNRMNKIAPKYPFGPRLARSVGLAEYSLSLSSAVGVAAVTYAEYGDPIPVVVKPNAPIAYTEAKLRRMKA